ncbi:type II secretion system protein [Thalassolituus sp. LLYu03]|uniref:type II secretion system protein n=1 Tax=Thalassolituus sp. LLYu03 TaxID=3421656 RepID=UPI003D2D9430
MSPRPQGFTLVELIMVILLIGILSAAGMSLFARSDAFSALAARDRMMAMGLVAQKRALANSGAGGAVTFTVAQSSSSFVFSVLQNSVLLASDAISRSGLSLSLDGSAMVDGQTETISFAADGSTGANRQWLFSGSQSRAFCQTSTGFLHDGNCQP